MKIILVAGARPNFPKIAPIAAALRQRSPGFDTVVVHTGQHYDYQLSDVFFEELELGPPDHFLGALAGAPGPQMADILAKFDAVLAAEEPDLVVVVGDVSSTVACSLSACARQIPVAHVEAGLRSGDRTMPEEVNRVTTDAMADLLFTHCADADANLQAENVPSRCIFRVGNVMIDTLLRFRQRARHSDALRRFGLADGDYGLVTLHRPSNVDDEQILRGLVQALERIATRLPLLFPVHPRTRQRLQASGLEARLAGVDGVRLVDPVGYVDMVCLMDRARLALVDSGGIQEETTVLGVPCLTLRHNTERPVTISEGTNALVGTDPEGIVAAAEQVLEGTTPEGGVPDLWDGRSAERLVDVLETMRREGGIPRR